MKQALPPLPGSYLLYFRRMLLPERQHIKSLDGIRGIAILLVLTYHLLNFGFLFPFFNLGWMGVDLFFVLSGFLITGILLDTKFQKGFIQSFLLRRALRTLPLYYAVLIGFSVIAPFLSPVKWFTEYQVYFWTHTSNFLFLQKGFFVPLGHFWSLAIEEQFYLFWPFVVLVLTPKRLLAFSILLIATGIFLRIILDNPLLNYGLPFAHLDGILIGAIIAVLIRSNPEALFRHSSKIFVACSILFVSYIAFNFNTHNGILKLPLTFTVISLFFGSLLIVSIRSKTVGKFFSNKLLLFFGKYSYGMYVFNSIFFHFSNWAGVDRLTGNQKLIPYSGVFLLTVAVSYLSYTFFEVKFLQLKKRVSRLYMA
jgi:peptidoglycan/LPS O-acetylase OafA/YrhL